MKMSFSLSSLQPPDQSLERQGQAGITMDRPYNSLTKKRKDPKQIYCQRMWTTRDECKDDFWAAIRTNYDYIMDTNLIDSCKEANGELMWDETDVATQSWSLKEVSSQFSELYTWLRVLQELVYCKEENLLDKSLRAAHMEELRRRAYRRKLFNEQASKLVSRAPSLKDEVAWRVDHLNAKWELVEQIMAPIERPISNEQDISADFDHEVKCLRKWLREMESRLQPLSFHVDWTLAELEEKAVEHMVLQRDIEAHGRIVSSVVKLGDKVYSQQQEQEQKQEKPQSPQALQIARSLERRWHLLFLRALEWQCHIETLASRVSNKNVVPYRCSSDSDEEPVTKQPRLSRRHSRGSGRESPGQSGRSMRSDRSERARRLRATRSRYFEDPRAGRAADLSDSDASSENRSIGDGSYFEDELCQLCVMDAKPEELEISEELAGRITSDLGDRGEEADIEEGGTNEEERNDMPPTPDTVPMTTSTAIEGTCDQIDGMPNAQSQPAAQSNSTFVANETPKRRHTAEEVASFSTSDRKSKNCATFYFRHLDTDSEADGCRTTEDSPNVVDDSSEEEWTYTSARRGGSLVVSEQRKTNVVVRLDFGEPPQIDVSEKLCFVENGAKTSDESARETERTMESSNEEERTERGERDSDDETRNDKTSIQRLIKEVEKLVGEERRSGTSRTLPRLVFEEKGMASNHRAKYARIKEWLKLNSSRGHEGRSTMQPLDSCDASGEYTTEESDGERQSVSSEDLQSSVATYRRFDGTFGYASQSVSQEIFDEAEKTPVNEAHPVLEATSTPKVVMRSKQKSNGPRPWSVSCISQIGNNSELNQTNDPISQFSISETALHQLIATPPTKSVSLDATGSRKSFNNSTSTLLEESIICHDGRVVRNSSLRRKKSRLRKKNLGRKSDSSSEGVNVNHSAGSDGSSNQQRSPRKINVNRTMRTVSRDCHGRLTTLVKSGSFSGCTTHQQLSVERTIASDPTPPFRLPCCNSVASTSETEEDRLCNRGCFTYEENLLDTVLNSKDLCNQQVNMDSDVEMNSLGNNSFSEQAWDNYQEKYMSEPYSEAPDLETARRLLDFGDDYRNFLDSQSDCASSMSAVPASSPLPRSRMHHEINDTTEDSESDAEDIRNVVEKSQSQLVVAENLFLSPGGSIPEDCTEVESACRENLRCLHALMESMSGSSRGEKYTKQVRGKYTGQIHRAPYVFSLSYMTAILITVLSGLIFLVFA